MSQRRWGTTRCRKFLARHHISETKTLGALTDRQRRLLADELELHRAERGRSLLVRSGTGTRASVELAGIGDAGRG